jgi:hypothetical protein
VSWRIAAASVIGTSHQYAGTECQDDCWAFDEPVVDAEPPLALFVADGAGSAAQGGDGARLAMETAARFVGSFFASGQTLTEDIGIECVEAVRDAIYQEAERSGMTPRDYACTFLGVIALPQRALAIQIGDGGIVLDAGNGLEVPIAPMSGEYANMTHFVSDEDAVRQLVTRLYNEPVTHVAVFSDGLQRLALNLAGNTPHVPFFSPFFDVLAKASEDKRDQLQAGLVQFLSSDAVNSRTDDDKTLALAVKV